VPASAAEARRAARSALTAWGLSRHLGLDDTVQLLVTELVSNGVRHARTPLELVLKFDGSRLRISLADGDPRLPVAAERQELTVGGFGLALIGSLSTNWGTDLDAPRGKTVWFEIDTTVIETQDEDRQLAMRRSR
jgi:anti-sigma regulatory factor (Ser/Thr protein kinase)